MPHRRIELCGDAPRAPMWPCKRQVWPLPGGTPGPADPAGASPKRKIPGGSGDRVTRFLQQYTKENRKLRVRFFGGSTGLPRAIDLLKAEYELRVHNRTAQKAAPLAAAGAKLDRSGCDSDAAAPGCVG